MSLVLNSAAVSDIGLGRTNNEDSAHSGPRLIAVADGIGGMPAGELASAIVIRELAPLDELEFDDTASTDDPALAGLYEPTIEITDNANSDTPLTRRTPGVPITRDSAITVLVETVASANQKIRDISDADQAADGMGTTVTALLLAGDRLALLHVGDSRGYVLHEGELAQITKDDTYVQTLVDQGLITLAEARVHPRRSVVMQAVQGLEYEPTCALRPAIVGDRYLVCSDGLSDVVDESVIAEAMNSEPDPAACARLLVAFALEAGAPDNVTVVVADVRDATG